MSKLFLIFSLLLIIECQHQTVVTHYDLDGNLISEEIQQPIEDEEIQYDSMMASSDNITEQKQQTQENFSSNLLNDSNTNSMVPTADSDSLQSLQNTDEQTNFISSQFEILPVVNKQEEQESALEQQQYQQQELERQQQLEILQANENVDWTPNQADTSYNQLDENQEEFSQVEIDTNLQPVVETNNHVLDIQQPEQQQIDINQENQQSELTQNQQFNSQEQIIQQQAVNELEQQIEQPVQVQQVEQPMQEQKPEEKNNVTQDMPIQKQIFQPVQNQENNQKQENDNNTTSEPQMKITSNIEQDQIEVFKDIHTISKISQDMIQSEENNLITKDEEPQQQPEENQQQPSQIEEDISFDMDDQNSKIDIPAQPNIEENSNQNDQTINTDQEFQEITQESFQAKENEELSDGIKQASQIVQGNCIVIYSECQYQGLGLEVCDSLEQIEKFKHQIKAVYIPKGYGLTIFENQNFNGRSRKYTSSQSCIQNPVAFIQLQVVQESVLMIQNNLRGKK